jgi:beta-N-acetylhexosaminidase
MRFALPQDAKRRRRLSALVAGCLVALVTGVEVGARSGDEAGSLASARGDGDGSEKAPPVDDLSLRQQVGQLVMLRFDGTERPTYVQEALRAGEAAGAILFGDNVLSAQQLRDLTGSLQQAAGRSALLAVDQEGGDIRIVPFAAPEPAAGTIARPALAEQLARQAGRDLDRLGINVNLAPVADVASVPGSVVAGRAYPGEADAVASLVAAAVRGHRRGGVASTAKHFPGIGAAELNTDDAAVTIKRPRAEIEKVDLEPFRAAIDAEVELVMAGHALYPTLDDRRIASQSAPILEGVLREELGYRGVIVTDSMEAEAVLSRSSTPEAAVRAVAAGADLMLTTSSGSYMPVFKRLLGEAKRSEKFRARVEESAARVLRLKERLGLRPPAPAK